MVSIKRLILGVLVVSALLAVGGLSNEARAERSPFRGVCFGDESGAPNDNHYFPFGFMCPSDPIYRENNNIRVYLAGNPTPIAGSATTGLSESATISPGQTLVVRGEINKVSPSNPGITRENYYWPTGQYTNSPEPNPLVWTYVDGDNVMFDGITGYSNPSHGYIPGITGISSGGVADTCPGQGAPHYQPVVGHRDIDAIGNTFGRQQSPYAWSGGSMGKVDCQTQGKMVYWRNNPATTFEFTIKTSAASGGPLCLRQNVSVAFSTDTDAFTPNSSPWPVGDPDQNSIASHLVKQSGQVCINVTNPPPTGELTGECRRAVLRNGNGTGGGATYTTPGGRTYRTNTVVNIDNVAPPVSAGYSNSGGGYGNGIIGFGDTRSWTYEPTSTAIRITAYHIYHNTDTGRWGRVPGSESTQVYPCFSATCNITSMTGTGPGGLIQAGDRVFITADITNTGPQPLLNHYRHYPLGLTVNGGGPGQPEPSLPNGVGLSPGQTLSVAFHLNVPSEIGYFSFSAYPSYLTFFGLGGSCNGAGVTYPVPIYMPFEIRPRANVSNGGLVEDPSTVEYSTGGTKTAPPGVDVTAAKFTRLIKRSGGVTTDVQVPAASTHAFGSVDNNFSYPVGSKVAGDEYCAHVRISPAAGWVGPGGLMAYTSDREATSGNCLTISNRPYVHVFGADASAGGGFGDSCTVKDGKINAYVGTTGLQPRGSGVQLGALAIGSVKGFSSASLRTSSPTGSNGLTFANKGSTPSGAGAPTMGGELGPGFNGCVPDYFESKPSNVAANTSTNNITINLPDSVANNTDTRYYRSPPGGTLVINASTIGHANNVAIFVEGNVRITGSIKYSSPDWGTIERVPSFYVIAKGGNIYIDPGVTELDGLYVAQPNGTNGGKIYSCSNGTDAFALNSLLANCRSQLVVNGAFVADQIYLTRSFGSLRDGSAGEYYTRAAKACGDSGVSPLGDCAAEIFNFSPELYLGLPGITPPEGPTTGKFDYITSLSPVL